MTGMRLVSKRAVVFGLVIVSSLPMTQRPLDSAASLAMVGPSARHGGHHVAQASTSNGLSPASARIFSKFASVTSMGSFDDVADDDDDSVGNLVPHFPQTGCLSE